MITYGTNLGMVVSISNGIPYSNNIEGGIKSF